RGDLASPLRLTSGSTAGTAPELFSEVGNRDNGAFTHVTATHVRGCGAVYEIAVGEQRHVIRVRAAGEHHRTTGHVAASRRKQVPPWSVRGVHHRDLQRTMLARLGRREPVTG